MSAGLQPWKERVAEELKRLGFVESALALITCGEAIHVQDCEEEGCGERFAVIEVRASCDVRVCPWCARVRAKERVDRVTAAALKVPDYTTAQAPDATAKLRAALDQAERALPMHALRGLKARAAADAAYAAGDTIAGDDFSALALRHEARAEKVVPRIPRLKWQLRRIADTRWGWKKLTIAPQWNPLDPRELTVEGLRARVARAWAAWDRVWEYLHCGGLVSATASIELSDHGLVHLHALIYAPFLVPAFLAKLAGCHIKLNAVEVDPRDVADVGVSAAIRHAVREAVKYTCKLPTPKSGAWVAGEHFGVLHPELAARWVVATSRVQLSQVYGPLRDALESEPEAPPEAQPKRGHDCPACGKLVTAISRVMLARDVARVLGPTLFRYRITVRRQIGGG